MRLLCDENLLGAETFFAPLGELQMLPGRDIRPEHVAAADALLLRSQTRLDATLLGSARPCFVGTGTVGTEHIDTALLRRLHVPFASAPGCNADAVADWVLSVVAHGVLAGRLDPHRSRCAVIGCGAIGGRVARRLVALGFEVVLNDPPLQASGAELPAPHVDLDAALGCDLVTLHVPLVEAGPHATRRLLDAAAVARLVPGAVLVNAARGGVLDDAAVLARQRREGDLLLALDVFEAEPDLPLELVDACRFATPHIAGHSLDGKAMGTQMIHAALCRVLGRNADVTVADILPSPPPPVAVGRSARDGFDFLARSYDIVGDTARLRDGLRSDASARDTFDALRRDYPPRRDFSAQRVLASDAAARVCAAAGFEVIGPVAS